MKKYEFTEKQMIYRDGSEKYLLEQIRACVDIPAYDISAGDIGGWIESENNLSHHGACWIKPGVAVYKGSTVKEDILVESNLPYSAQVVQYFVKNSHLSGDGTLRNPHIENTTIVGKNIDLISMELSNCHLTGQITGIQSILENVKVHQQGEKRISMLKCFVFQKSGTFKISNSIGHALSLEGVEFHFSEDNTEREVIGYGVLSYLLGRDLNHFQVYGKATISHVIFEGACSFKTQSFSKLIFIHGKEDGKILFKNSSCLIRDSRVIGENIVLSGSIELNNSSLSHYSSIQNDSLNTLEVINVNMIDSASIILYAFSSSTRSAKGLIFSKGARVKVENKSLQEDDRIEF